MISASTNLLNRRSRTVEMTCVLMTNIATISKYFDLKRVLTPRCPNFPPASISVGFGSPARLYAITAKNAVGINDITLPSSKLIDPIDTANIPTRTPPTIDPAEATAQKGPLIVFACLEVNVLFTNDQICSTSITIYASRKTYMTAAAKRMSIVKAKKHTKIKQLEKRDVIAKARVAPNVESRRP